MNFTWRELNHISSGGPVLKVDRDNSDHYWLASPAGLFSQNGNAWHAVMRGIPFWQVNTVLAAEEAVWVAGLPKGLIRSTNGGKSWQSCLIEQATTPVLTMIASPRYARDRTLLAGTDGDGILRSTDGGRHWRLSNFGLREFAVLDLACAPEWGKKEPVFAVTENSLYRSPNAGRAWKRSRLPSNSLKPAAVAVSPRFAADQTVYVGCEDGTLLVSRDGGTAFEVAEAIGPLPSINALHVDPEGQLILGTGSGIITLSPSGRKKEGLTEPILSLSVAGGTLFAGLADGLMVSDDSGGSWRPVEAMAARRFVWMSPISEEVWVAGGPNEGLFMTEDGGGRWEKRLAHPSLLAIAIQAPNTVWISAPEGLFVSPDLGRNWHPFYQPKSRITSLASRANDQTLYAGTESGEILQIDPIAKKITALKTESAFKTGRPLGLYFVDRTLLAAIWSTDQKEMQIWSRGPESASWQLIFSRPGNPVTPHIVARESGRMALGLKSALYQWEDQKRIGGKITDPASPVTGLGPIQGSDKMLMALTDHLVLVDSNNALTQLESPLDGTGIIAIEPVPGTCKLLVGAPDGKIFIAEPSVETV